MGITDPLNKGYVVLLLMFIIFIGTLVWLYNSYQESQCETPECLRERVTRSFALTNESVVMSNSYLKMTSRDTYSIQVGVRSKEPNCLYPRVYCVSRIGDCDPGIQGKEPFWLRASTPVSLPNKPSSLTFFSLNVTPIRSTDYDLALSIWTKGMENGSCPSISFSRNAEPNNASLFYHTEFNLKVI